MKRGIAMVFVLLALALPVSSLAGESCDMATKYQGKNLYWNTMCWFDTLIGWE